MSRDAAPPARLRRGAGRPGRLGSTASRVAGQTFYSSRPRSPPTPNFDENPVFLMPPSNKPSPQARRRYLACRQPLRLGVDPLADILDGYQLGLDVRGLDGTPLRAPPRQTVDGEWLH